ncbi:MAG: class II aldolase/adducin family protein [Bacteroidales bacterium]|jgi:L-fuculose-phosphate aldolase|nr:class II aldolase/adducin family protein [Bacteroidales bacterium]
MIFRKERKEVAKIMRRLYKRGLTTASGGNVSFKNKEGYIFITASQTDKACIKPEEIIVFDNKLNNLTPDLKPSMEYNMHFMIYEGRPDISAVVHSHPLFASTFAVLGMKINTTLTGEARYILGEIEEIDYSLMGTTTLAEICACKMKNADAGIMKNHGAITLGSSLFEAYDRMEVLELTANINYNILTLNKEISVGLNSIEVSEIDKLKNK